ncbi:MAG TPA: Asp-tRNA(Asn)/Glu-tRNA(Gln) amidotransferase subunit GatA [Candidatus Paceibacterota bacterium]
MDFSKLTIKKARELLDSKELSVKDLVDFYLKNLKEKNGELNAYLEVYDDMFLQAEQAQEIINAGKSTELTGIPLAIKDNILIKNRKVSAASKMLENYKATYTATAVQKIIDQGAVFLGRTNMDEFAMGGSTENSAFGVTKNPYDHGRVAGGTSGGSAAAIAADMALGALGSDTGGSIRQPSSFCGVVGLKPTYGSVSRYGLMAAVSSFDVIGPIAKNTSDAEILFNVMKGQDDMDSTSIDSEGNPTSLKLRGTKVGVPYHLLEQEGVSEEVKNNFNESVKKLEDLGFEIVDVNLKNSNFALPIYYILNFAEISSNMSRYDGMRYGLQKEGEDLLDVYNKSRGEGLGPEVRRRIILGTYVLSAGYYDSYYGKAMYARKILQQEFEEVFKNVDAILTPTSPTPAWKIGEKTSPLEEYLADIFTVTANIVGCPAISLPSGFSKVDGKDLPLGIQLMASHGDESLLFQIGKKFLNEN